MELEAYKISAFRRFLRGPIFERIFSTLVPSWNVIFKVFGETFWIPLLLIIKNKTVLGKIWIWEQGLIEPDKKFCFGLELVMILILLFNTISANFVK